MAIEKVKSSSAAATSNYEHTNWKTPAFRQSMVQKINKAIEDAGIHLQCTGLELENGVFEKVNSKPMYMILIICIIENIKEMGKNAEDKTSGSGGLILPSQLAHLSEFENLLLY